MEGSPRNRRGLSWSASSSDGMAAGAAAYLAKPFRTAQLRALVQKLCPPPSPVSTPTHEGFSGQN